MTSLGEEHNPYAAPQAELQVQSIQSAPAVLYPMSAHKAAAMSVLTLGLYDLVFWYRHWTRLKETGWDFNAFARTFFAPFTAFRFVSILSSMRSGRDLEPGTQLKVAPFVYLALSVGSRLSDKLLVGIPSLAFTAVACAGGAWVLATIQHGVNEVLEADGYQGPSDSGANVGALIASALGLMFWIFVIVGSVSPELLEE